MTLTRVALACCLSLFAFPAFAQSDVDGGTSAADAPAPGTEPSEARDAGTLVLVPAAAVTPPPAAPAATELPPAVKQVLSMFRVYGMFKPTVSAASAATESFSQPNMSAITAAGNPVYSNAPNNGRLSFQIAQSRLGVWFGEGSPYRAQVELDFIDFSKASPTVAALPRLRIAKIEWAPNDVFTIMAGQDWDLAQPVNPHGINLVGGAFQAGNLGFMRQQIKALAKVSDFEFAIAAGMQVANVGAKDALTELSFTPTAAARAQWNVNKKGRLGISGLVTSLLMRGGTDPQRTLAGFGGAYGDISITPDFNLRFEAYVGQNVANLGALGISQGRANAGADAINLKEVGGFASTRFSLFGPVSAYATLGAATMLNPDDVVPSYNYGAAMLDPANPPAFTTSALAGTGPGMHFNVHGRLGFDVKIGKGLSVLAEGFWYRTKFALQSIDVARTTPIGQTFGTEFGFLWQF